VSSSISNFIEYKDIASKIDDRQTRLEKENNNVISLTVSLADSDSVIAELKNEAESVREKAKDAEKRLKELNEQSRLFAEKQRMRASLFKSVERLNKVTEPEKNPEFDKISDYLSGLAQLTSELEAKVKLKKILQEGGVCPTCGSEFKDSETTLDDVIAEIEALNKSIKTMQARLSSLKAGKDKYDRNRHKYIEEKASIESEIKITSNKLKEYENVAEVDEDERVKLEAAIEDYKDITGRAAELEQNNKAINQNLEKAKSTVSALEKEIEDLREKSKISIVSQKEYEALVKILEEYNKIKSELTELKVRADSSKKVIDDYSASIEKYEKDIERSKNIIEFKNTLETVKTILHRDKLPKRSLMSYISELDSEINAFLKYFSNPFCLTITEDMDLICTMPSGHIRPAHRLSGGQRAVLSVCTRFALCEIFSKNIGLLVLDEPSQNLDQERVKFLAEFMKHVNAASKNAAAQTIVITHHVDEMGSVFDNNIVLSN
jgi:DNA repair exonuclease SbcCD ATPase subunit